MTDFSKSFLKGIEAAKLSEIRRQEIKDVFDRLNHQLTQHLEGRVTIKIETFSRHDTLTELSLVFRGQKIPTYDAIAVFSSQDKLRYRILAEWEQNKHGYPCTITFNKTEFRCEDKMSLEFALNEMLANPEVGEKIYEIMIIESPAKEGTTAMEKKEESSKQISQSSGKE